jgi:pimeloyl-ACP methyl ester carboxylesterase
MVKKALQYILWTIALLLLVITGFAIWHWHSDIPKAVLREKYAPSPSRFIDVKGMEVHFRDEVGSCDSLPLVLLHGTGASLHTWDGWVKSIGKKHRIIRLDLPAYGLTGANPEGDYSMDFYVDFLHEFLKKMYVEKCVLAGNSFGGAIAWNYALQHPDIVKKLILIDAAGFPSKNSEKPLAFALANLPIISQLFKFVTPRIIVEKSLLNVYGDKTKVSDSLVDRYFELSLHEGNRKAFFDRMNAKPSPSRIQSLNTLQIPVLIMWGEVDKLIPLENAYKFQEALANDTLVIFKGIGHVPMEEEPVSTARVAEVFLENY